MGMWKLGFHHSIPCLQSPHHRTTSSSLLLVLVSFVSLQHIPSSIYGILPLCLFLSLFLVFLSLCNTLTYQSMTSCHPLSLSPTANLQNNIIPGVIFLNYALEPYSIIHHTYRNFNCKASRRKTKQKEKQERRCFTKRKGNEWELWQPKLTHKFFFFSSSCRPSSPFLCSWILLAWPEEESFQAVVVAAAAATAKKTTSWAINFFCNKACCEFLSEQFSLQQRLLQISERTILFCRRSLRLLPTPPLILDTLSSLPRPFRPSERNCTLLDQGGSAKSPQNPGNFEGF